MRTITYLLVMILGVVILSGCSGEEIAPRDMENKIEYTEEII